MPDRQLLCRLAGALGLLVVALRLWTVARYDGPAGVDALSGRFVGASAVLVMASLLALTSRLAAAGTALLVGVTLPQVCLNWANLAQFQALLHLMRPDIRHSPDAIPLLSWIHAGALTLTLVVAALALAARPDLRRLRRDPFGVALVLLGAAFAAWFYVEHELGHWHEQSPVLGTAYDALVALAVVLPLLWGMGLPQPARKLLLIGWVATQAVYWSAWLQPRIPQREHPYLLLIPPLLVLAAVVALRPAAEVEELDDYEEAER